VERPRVRRGAVEGTAEIDGHVLEPRLLRGPSPLGVALIIAPWNFPFQYARRTL
jgi:acyl-CoA reductase-like NAD-dependent aldehyde dehydrogenase